MSIKPVEHSLPQVDVAQRPIPLIEADVREIEGWDADQLNLRIVLKWLQSL